MKTKNEIKWHYHEKFLRECYLKKIALVKEEEESDRILFTGSNCTEKLVFYAKFFKSIQTWYIENIEIMSNSIIETGINEDVISECFNNMNIPIENVKYGCMIKNGVITEQD